MAELVAGQIEMVPIDELVEHPQNARRGDLTTIVESIKRNGFYGVVVRQASSGYTIVGNHRQRGAKEAGLTALPTQTADVDDAAALRILAVDNRSNDLAGYDDPALFALLQAIGLDELPGSGFDEQAYLDLEASVAADADELTDPDDAPPLEHDVVTQVGDVWLLGDHRVWCGSATDEPGVAAVVGEALADCCWTDPPYGVSYEGKTADRLTIRNDGVDDLPAMLRDAFTTAALVLKPGAPVYVACPDLHREEFAKHMGAAGIRVRQYLVWVKNAFTLGHSDYQYQHEPVLEGETPGEQETVEHEELVYGFAAGGSGRLGRGGSRWYGTNNRSTVFFHDKPSANRDHPTMKPVALVKDMLRNSCPTGGKVLDLFGGSGSTLIAAHQLRMRSVLVELDPRYVDVICRRWQAFTGEQPVLAVTGEARDFG